MLKGENIWNLPESINDAYSRQIIQHKFLAAQNGEAITAEKDLLLRDVSHLAIADEIARMLDTSITGDDDKNYVVLGQLNDYQALVYITQGSKSRNTPAAYDVDEDDIIGIRINRVKIEMTAHRTVIKSVFSHLSNLFKEAKISSVKWWFQADHGASSREIFLEPLTTHLYPEYYPWIGEDTDLPKNPKEYLEKYLKSAAAVLMVAGLPGSGKTTLLRHLICDFNLTADIIYDEKVMDRDTVFQEFLFSKSQIMLIEDADSILAPREGRNNPLMSRFLNVSDGIIKLPEKKLVFTTNMSEFDKVDPALIRPGRCFDVLKTRKLTYQEACAVAKMAEIEIPSLEKPYTLAEVLNSKTVETPRKIGF